MIKAQHLIHAKALIEYGTFGKAAHARNISRPAFSRSIAKLEESLGVKLFHRHPTGVTLTSFGQIVNKYIREFVTTHDELVREIRIAQGLGMGSLSVAAAPFPGEISAHQAVGKLIAKYPNLRCKVTLADWMKVERMVVHRKVDIGLAEISEAKNHKYMETESLGNHKVLPICRPGHPLMGKKQVTEYDLNKYPLVLTKVAKRASGIPGKNHTVVNKEYLLPAIEIEDITLSRKIVAESNAFSVAAPVQIESELEKGILSILPYEAPWLITNYGFMYLRDRALSPAAEKYMDVVREIELDANARNQALIKEYCPNDAI